VSTMIIRSGCGCVAQVHTGADRKRKGYVFEFDYCPPHLGGPALLRAAKALWDKEAREEDATDEWCDFIQAIEAAEVPTSEPLEGARR
jgi:hypothetical protein